METERRALDRTRLRLDRRISCEIPQRGHLGPELSGSTCVHQNNVPGHRGGVHLYAVGEGAADRCQLRSQGAELRQAAPGVTADRVTHLGGEGGVLLL